MSLLQIDPIALPDPGVPCAAPTWRDRFAQAARAVALAAGKPGAFLLALLAILLWAAVGPLFGFSDTWQLVINTGTTIITFLMVFLIQNTQNRDQLAMQVKLAELIVAMKGASDRMALAEELSDEELERLHAAYREKCARTLESIEARRASRTRASA